ncbi:unnamed protein product, partial [Ectocarpus sp. 4 AP-2014]
TTITTTTTTATRKQLPADGSVQTAQPVPGVRAGDLVAVALRRALEGSVGDPQLRRRHHLQDVAAGSLQDPAQEEGRPPPGEGRFLGAPRLRRQDAGGEVDDVVREASEGPAEELAHLGEVGQAAGSEVVPLLALQRRRRRLLVDLCRGATVDGGGTRGCGPSVPPWPTAAAAAVAVGRPFPRRHHERVDEQVRVLGHGIPAPPRGEKDCLSYLQALGQWQRCRRRRRRQRRPPRSHARGRARGGGGGGGKDADKARDGPPGERVGEGGEPLHGRQVDVRVAVAGHPRVRVHQPLDHGGVHVHP